MDTFGIIRGTLKAPATLSGTVAAEHGLSGSLTVPDAAGVIIYDGPYEYTPAATAQVISISEKKAAADIVINAIPSNYGLITWNGSALTVS